jgi:hypothetical protein
MVKKVKKVEEVKVVEVVKCERCNGKSSKEWIDVEGKKVGIECLDKVEELRKRCKGEVDWVLVRKEYLDEMREKTVVGMVLKGMLNLGEMIGKGKISEKRFLEICGERRRKERGEELVKIMKEGK